MKELTIEHFTVWLESYGKASAENDARTSAELFALDARYYETPFDDPLIGREAIFQYWLNGAHSLKDKESSFEIFSMKDNLGIARWQSRFTVIKTGVRHALDCLFLVEFDQDGLCSVFREWWHIWKLDDSQGK